MSDNVDNGGAGTSKRMKTSVNSLDQNFDNILREWLDDDDDKEFDSDCDGTDDEDYVAEESEYEDEISDDGGESEEHLVDNTDDIWKGRNGHIWSKKVPPSSRTPQRNIYLRVPGPKGAAKNVSEEREAWNLLFSDLIIDTIVEFTNKEVEKRGARYKDCRYVGATNCREICALIGLLYIAGCRKDGHLTVCEMWGPFGPEIYSCIMSRARFEFLITCIRFDDRETRKPDDKFAPIRDIWTQFISNVKIMYTPHEYCTVDEQLLGFKGNCPFRVYIPSKPDRYGIKIMTLCDSRTFYMVDALPYIGKEKLEKKGSLPSHYVRTLSRVIHGTYRNITMDNYFTSVPLADEMLNEYKLTIVGTLRKNKREIPSCFLPNKNKPIMSAQFGFSGKKTLVSFTPRKSKSVVLLSTMHSDKKIDENNGKPDIINFYNMTKGGVDTFDQLVHTYSVSRKTRRWPLRYFYGMLDQAGINAMILYTAGKERCKRRTFLFELGVQLAKEHILHRLTGNLPVHLRNAIDRLLGTPKKTNEEKQQFPNKLEKQARCTICDRKSDKKTKTACFKCGTPVCSEHRHEVCFNCL